MKKLFEIIWAVWLYLWQFPQNLLGLLFLSPPPHGANGWSMVADSCSLPLWIALDKVPIGSLV